MLLIVSLKSIRTWENINKIITNFYNFYLLDNLLASVSHYILDLALKSSDILLMQHGIGVAVELLKNKNS